MIRDRIKSLRYWTELGVTMREATEAVSALAKAASKVPFPEGQELRTVRLRAWRRDFGALRFCCPRWWNVFLRVRLDQ